MMLILHALHDNDEIVENGDGVFVAVSIGKVVFPSTTVAGLYLWQD